MKKIFLIFLSLILFYGSDCKREGDDCHRNVTIINNSNQTVLWAYLVSGSEGCRLEGKELHSNSATTYNPFGFCLERKLIDNELGIYIINPDKYNEPGIYYDCNTDSIFNKNNILRVDILTLQDLQNSNFTITYP